MSDNIWGFTTFLGMCLLVITFLVQYDFPNIVRWVWGYTLISALFVFMSPWTRFAEMRHMYDGLAGQAFAQVLLVPLTFMLIKTKHYKWVRWFLCLLALIECGLVFFNHWGLMLAPSFDTALIASCLLLGDLWFQIVALVAIFWVHGATAISIIIAQTFGLSITDKKLFYIAQMALVLVMAFALHSHDLLAGKDDRIAHWTKYMNWWIHQEDSVILFGTGLGTFQWLGPTIDNFNPPLFFQMHNEWLQILFELGTFGFILVCSFYAYLLYGVRNTPRLFASLMGFGAFGLTYHPLRFFPSLLVITFVVVESLMVIKKEKET